MTYLIKQTPEDFVVDEVLNIGFLTEEHDFIIYKLTKKSLNTIQVIDMISKQLHIKQKDIGFAGIKDKHGITTQYISFPKMERTRNITFNHVNVTLENVGFLNQPITARILIGNKFNIKVTNAQDYTVIPKDWMLNYFGEQRFSKNNVDVGRALIHQKFKLAVEHMLAFAAENPTYTERLVSQYLAKKPTDFVGAMRTIPTRNLTLYIHAYQSYMFNLTLSKLITEPTHADESIWATFTETKPEIGKLPVVGFYYKPEEYSQLVQDTVKSILTDEGITPRSFILRSMTEITEPGAVRESVVEIKDLKVTETNKGETKEFSFFLPKGTYATVALRQLLVTTKQ